MRHIAIAFAFVVGLGCGGRQAPPAEDAPACAAVAAHLVELAERDNRGEADAELAAGMQGELDRQCREAPWSPERRRCLAEAITQDATLGCPGS